MDFFPPQVMHKGIYKLSQDWQVCFCTYLTSLSAPCTDSSKVMVRLRLMSSPRLGLEKVLFFLKNSS